MEKESAFILVFAPCRRDSWLMKANLEWMFELDGQQHYQTILAYDRTLTASEAQQVRIRAEKSFDSCIDFIYPAPKKLGWPQAPNWAFQCVAKHMRGLGQPWFWYEPDAWPLRAGWLKTLAAEYEKCDKPVMGPIVPGMGHMNGVAVYPADFATLSPLAMSCVDYAWDAACKPDILGHVHDVADLICHAWGIGVNKFTDWGGVGYPTFPTSERLKWIKETAVLFHRCKDLSLMKQLRRKFACQK